MEPQTQAQIDGLIQFIENAENPATVTNEIVAAVLKYLMNKAKEVDSLDIDSRINRLSSTLDTLVSGNAANTIESFNEVIEFLAGVTDDETLSGLLLSLRNDIEGKTQKAGDRRLDPQEAPVVMLDSMGPTLDSVGSTSTVLHPATQGDYVYAASAIKYYKTYKGPGDSGNEVVPLGPPQQGLIYCNKKTGLQYRWAGSDTGWVQVGGNRVINDLTTGGTIDALSAEQGKVLKAMIEGLDVNSDTRIGVVDTPSDTVLAAPSARMVKEIYLNLRALFDSTNGLAGIAFLNGKPDWQTVNVPEHTITLGAMTNVSASLNGTSINDSTSADEGKVTILLTPSSNNYMSSISIKDASNHDVNFTQADVVGGTEITFILAGNVTINASAASGIQVDVSGTGITSYTTGVIPNTAAELTIVLPEHHTWGSVAVTYGGTDITAQCIISPANNTNKVITLPDTLSDMSKVISIVANAVEDPFAEVTIDTLTNATISRGNDTLESDDHVYENDVISIIPESGKKLTTATINGNALSNGDDYSGYTYQVLGTDVSPQGSTMTIVGAAEQVGQKTITFDTKWCVPYIGGEEVSGGSITVNEGSNVEVTIKPLDGFVMAKTQVGSTHGNIVIPTKDVYGDVKVDGVAVETDAFDKTNNECVVSLADITSDVTIFAKARLQIVRKAYYKNNTSAAKGYSMELYTNGDNDSYSQQEHAAIISMIPTSGLASTKFKYGSGYNGGAGSIGNIIFIRPNGNKYDNWGAGTAALSNGVRIIDLTSNYTDANIAGFVADVRATLAAGEQTSLTPLKDSNNKSLPYFAVSTDGGTTYTDIVSTDDLNNAYYIHYNDYTA